MGTLYLVATPIGNLEDVTLRALRVLAQAPLIAAEDTRTTRKLLSRHGIPAPKLLSYTERSHKQRTPTILHALDEGNVALVSEAGTPAISDPGFHLVEAAVAAGHTVEPLPGPSALVAALAASGLPTRRFHFLGFLPRKAGERQTRLRELAPLPATLVAYEAPHRLQATLRDMLDVLGDRRLAVCRELTKVHEEIYRASISDAIAHFAAPRGEITLVIEGGAGTPDSGPSIAVDAELRAARAEGVSAKDAVRAVTERSGLPRREIYARWIALE